MVSNWKNVFEPHVQTTLNRCGSPFPLNLFLNPLSYTMKYWFIGIRLIMDTIFPNQLDLISIIHNFIDQSTMIPHTPRSKAHLRRSYGQIPRSSSHSSRAWQLTDPWTRWTPFRHPTRGQGRNGRDPGHTDVHGGFPKKSWYPTPPKSWMTRT